MAQDPSQLTENRGPIVVVPSPSLVALVGLAGSGKSAFAARNFLPTEVVSSDRMRAAIADDEADQSVSAAAFDLVHRLVRARLAARRLAVVDATNVTIAARRPLIDLARAAEVPALAILLGVPDDECIRRDAARSGRSVGEAVIREQAEALARSRGGLATEGWTTLVILDGADEVENARVLRRP